MMALQDVSGKHDAAHNNIMDGSFPKMHEYVELALICLENNDLGGSIQEEAM